AIDTSEYIWDWDDAADGDSAAGWLIEYNRDCNDNGRLDESDICEDPGLDCDNDGRIDSCMVAESVVADCNQNGRPDSCDIDFGDADCNANGVPDTCDLDSGTSADCNANGVPDECDIKDGTSDDLNGTGIPDECELLVINEVLIDPQDDLNGDGVIDAGDQFVEIVNYTEESVDLTGWLLLNDGPSWHVFGGTILEPGCVVIVFNEATASTIYEPATVLSSTSTDALVSPSSGLTRTISLYEAVVGGGYALVDDVTYGTEVLQIDGASITRCPDLVGDFVPHNDDDSECYTGSSNMHSPGRQINGDVFPGECAVDSDGDGVLDLFDNCVLFNPDQADCDGNGIGDVCDIQDHIDGGGSHEDLDCNWNWVPDDCEFVESDCNNNGLPDACEVNDGTALDCNANGLLDECELDSGFSPDCNGNGIPDVCDINSGLSVDCNDNDVPDECDLLDPDQDTNENGVLDECECNSPCDVNTDGLCTIDDLLDIIKGQGCSAPGPCPGDFNGDGNTDVNDILDYFAAGC
ncbi:MAG: lamin tail domain-containing protein, partial [Phycisphaerae bacterium]|nr:lamin tail domain-containing protein [Phycisphaerae bacterium]